MRSALCAFSYTGCSACGHAPRSAARAGSDDGGATARLLAAHLLPGVTARAHSAPAPTVEPLGDSGGASPFEHVLLDAALEEVCRRLAADAARLQTETHPAVEDLMQARPCTTFFQ